MKIKHSAAILIFIVISMPAISQAAVRLVSPAGNDAGDCIAAPCLTITYAVGQSAAGDTVSVASGIYTEQVAVDKGISIAGAGRDSTVVDVPAGSYGIVIADGTSGVTISGLRFEGNANSANPQEGGILIEAPDLGVSDIAVTDNTFFGLDNGFEARGELSGIAVSENLFDKMTDWTSIEITTLNIGSGLPYTIDGVDITGNEIRNSLGVPIKLSNYTRANGSAMSDLSISDNFIHDNNGQAPHMESWTGGVALRHGATGVAIEDNDIRDNLNLSGISFAGAGTYNEVTIKRNYLMGNIGCDRSPFNAAELAAGIKFRSVTGPAVYSIENNAVSGNGHGMDRDGAATLMAYDNYWGCAEGPGAADCDDAAGALDADPWLARPPLEYISLDPQTRSLIVPQSFNMKVTAHRIDATADDVTAQCSFQTSDASVALVDASGLVTGVGDGSALIAVECTDEKSSAGANAEIAVAETTGEDADAADEVQEQSATPDGGSDSQDGGSLQVDDFAGLGMSGGGCAATIAPGAEALSSALAAVSLFLIGPFVLSLKRRKY